MQRIDISRGFHHLTLQHPHQSKIGVQCPAESAIPERSTWDKVRTDLLLAQQLAMHRQQLAKLIESHTKEVDDKQLGKRDVERMMRSKRTALLHTL